MEAYISWGSNLGDQENIVEEAISTLHRQRHTKVIKTSKQYRSKAVGPGEQPDYLNGVIKIDTELTPIELLDYLQSIEQQHGRKRIIRWGARTLDLDILLYGEVQIDHPRLTVPHPRIEERAFVIIPLMDVAPATQQINGRTLKELSMQTDRSDLSLWSPY